MVHAVDLDLGSSPDHVLLERAIQAGRTIVTRDVADFAPLVEACARAGRHHSGVLFLSQSIPAADGDAHVRAIEAWLAAIPAGENPAADTFVWLAGIPK